MSTLGLFTVLFLWWWAHLCFFQDVHDVLICLLKLSTWRCTWTAQTLLQDMGICRLYPLVVILFRFNYLKAKLLVKVNGRLIADLNMTNKEKKNVLVADYKQ